MYRTGVSALILNSKQEFLLVNLSSFEDKYFAVPGGGLEEGETLEEAVYREIQEELGITHDLLRIVRKSNNPLFTKFKAPKKGFIGSERYFFGFEFIGRDADIQLHKQEVRRYAWVKFDDLKQYLLFDNQLEDTVQKIKEIFGV